LKKIVKRRPVTANTVTVTAAKEDSALDNALDDISANFDYIMDGFLKLQREGATQEKEALSIALELSSMIDSIGNKVAQAVIGG